MSSLIGKIEDIAKEVKEPKDYLPIMSFTQIRDWKERPFRKLGNYGKCNEVTVEKDWLKPEEDEAWQNL